MDVQSFICSCLNLPDVAFELNGNNTTYANEKFTQKINSKKKFKSSHEHINDWTSIFYCLFEASFVAAKSKVCLELIRQNSVIFLILLFSKSKYINKLENCRQLAKNIFKTFLCSEIFTFRIHFFHCVVLLNKIRKNATKNFPL